MAENEERPPAARVITRFLEERPPGAPRDLALTGLALWETLSQRNDDGGQVVDATILFADLVGFSRWVLEVGDEPALELLRAVAAVVEPAITTHRGRLVKRLGDGHMAAFPQPLNALEAALAMQRELGSATGGASRHVPRLRVGVHAGQPRRLDGDYLGTDVNIAARVGAAAGPGEVLASATVLDAIGHEPLKELRISRRRGFRAKGVPSNLAVFSVTAG
jgi:adenylate cyclase